MIGGMRFDALGGAGDIADRGAATATQKKGPANGVLRHCACAGTIYWLEAPEDRDAHCFTGGHVSGAEHVYSVPVLCVLPLLSTVISGSDSVVHEMEPREGVLPIGQAPAMLPRTCASAIARVDSGIEVIAGLAPGLHNAARCYQPRLQAPWREVTGRCAARALATEDAPLATRM